MLTVASSALAAVAGGRVTTGAERFLRQVERAPQVALLGLDLGPLAEDGLELRTAPCQPGHPRGLIEDADAPSRSPWARCACPRVSDALIDALRLPVSSARRRASMASVAACSRSPRASAILASVSMTCESERSLSSRSKPRWATAACSPARSTCPSARKTRASSFSIEAISRFGVGGAEVGEALRAGRERRFQVPELVVAQRQREQEHRPSPIVEQIDHRAGLLEVAERAFGLIVARLDHRQRDEDPQAKLRIDAQPLGDLVEQSKEELASAVALLEFVEPAGLPVRRPCRVGVSPLAAEQLGRLRGRPNRFRTPFQPIEAFGQAAQEFRPDHVRRARVEEILVGVDGLLPIAGGEMQVRLESGPGRLTSREQLRDRDLRVDPARKFRAASDGLARPFSSALM